MRTYPVTFVWREIDVCVEGGEVVRAKVMVPEPRFAKVCDKQFSVNELYPLVVMEPRSRGSHNFYFATIGDIFENLPEAEAARFPSTEHFRKWALCEAGYADEKTYVCDNHKKAMQLAALIRSISDYAIIRVSGDVVKIFEAKSQSAAAMGKEIFEESKKAVLDIMSALTSTSTATFAKEAARKVPPEKRRAQA